MNVRFRTQPPPTVATPDPSGGIPPTVDDLCRSILMRHHDTISVRNRHVAVPRLRVILEGGAGPCPTGGGFQAMSLARPVGPHRACRLGGLCMPISTGKTDTAQK